MPYRTAKFTQTSVWEVAVAERISAIIEGLMIVEPWKYGSRTYMEFMNRRSIRGLKQFLQRYGEGALVMLALFDCAGQGGWRDKLGRNDICLTAFPRIEGKDPIEIWRLIESLRLVMFQALGKGTFSSLFIKYLDGCYGYSYDKLDDKLYWVGFHTSIGRYPIYDDIKRRKDVQALKTVVRDRWEWFAAHHRKAAEWWSKFSAEPEVRYYLLCRAADLVSFGERYAGLPPAAFAPYEEVVGALVSLSKDTRQRLEAAGERQEAIRERQNIEVECAEKIARISCSPPTALSPRVLSGSEIEKVKNACIEQLKQDATTIGIAATIDDFAVFCGLLSKPENQLKVRSAQMEEKVVKTRTVADMTNEMAGELINLPRYTAYARFARRDSGEEKIVVQKIRTVEPPVLSEGISSEERSGIIERASAAYYLGRAHIEEEIRTRQERWRKPVCTEVPRGQGDHRDEPESPPRGEAVVESAEPPAQFSYKDGDPPPQSS